MKNDRYSIHYWAVAFIDVLGQQEAMKKIDFLPDETNTKQMEEYIAGIKKSYGKVKGIQDMLIDFKKSYESKTIDGRYKKLSKKDKKIYEQMQSSPLAFQKFSDGLMAYVPLADQYKKSPTSGVYCIFCACATAMIISLAGKSPIRGGIDIATGMEMKQGELYGPVVARAYNLENKIAQYPRIVIGDGCIDFLKQYSRLTPNNKLQEFEREMAAVCLGLLTIDVDGYAIIDFLGNNCKLQVAEHLDLQVITAGREYVITELDSARQNKNTKLAFRYSNLLNYYDDRMHIWSK